MKIEVAMNLAVESLIQAQKIMVLVHAAQMKGKSELTAEEDAQIVGDRDAAFGRLDKSIEQAEVEGR